MAASKAIKLRVDIGRHVVGRDFDLSVVKKRNVQKRV